MNGIEKQFSELQYYTKLFLFFSVIQNLMHLNTITCRHATPKKCKQTTSSKEDYAPFKIILYLFRDWFSTFHPLVSNTSTVQCSKQCLHFNGKIWKAFQMTGGKLHKYIVRLFSIHTFYKLLLSIFCVVQNMLASVPGVCKEWSLSFTEQVTSSGHEICACS